MPLIRRLNWLLMSLLIGLIMLSCVDPEEVNLPGTVNVVVVDGTLTNLAEPQIIKLNRSRADSLTGRFGTLPIQKASVVVVVDSAQVVVCHETIAGSYQLPSDFRGQVGHAYQLRIILNDGTQYQSDQQIMPPAVPIDRVTAQFNPKAIDPPFVGTTYTAGHDLFLDFTDPTGQTNYYRWEWIAYEPQSWCRSCYEGFYAVDQLTPILPYSFPTYFLSTSQPYEDCFYPTPNTPPALALRNHQFDYPCRTQCWELIYSHSINVFSDQSTNGNTIRHQSVAHVPFYQSRPCLVDIRQESLTKAAHAYFDKFQQQTQNAGGVTDSPPTALGGNIRNLAHQYEVVVGYFTASAVTVYPYYLSRTDTQNAKAPGLFYALNGRDPIPETRSDPDYIVNGPVRPPTAVCGPLNQRTPYKPAGWRD